MNEIETGRARMDRKRVDSEREVQDLADEFIAEGIAGAALERPIEWVDTDAAGHQHNSVIMRFVEAAEARLFRDAKLNSYFAIAPRVRHETNYRAKLYFGQNVTAAVRIDSLGRSSMSFSFKIWGHPHEGNGTVLAADGQFVTVCVPVGEAASSPWPSDIRSALTRGRGEPGQVPSAGQ